MVPRVVLCFKAINVIYRNAIVNHIRKVFLGEYPDDWELHLRDTFRNEWDTVKTNAETARKSGELRTALRDEFDLLSVNHFYNLFERYFGDLFPQNSDQTTEGRKNQRQAILGWARHIKRMRDPVIGHPGEVDVSIEDTLAMLDSASRLLEWVHPDASKDIREIWEAVRSDNFEEGINYAGDDRVLEASTLPARESVVPSFVGRQEELCTLKEWLNDRHSHVKLLAGDGGKGKTAIAYEFAVSLLNDPPETLDALIWLSAKSRRFVQGASIGIETPDFWDLRSGLKWVLGAYGAPEVDGISETDKEKSCIEYLSELPALIVLDDVDSLEGQDVEAMNFFMHRTHQTKSKILMTSRRIPFGMEPNTLVIEGFGSVDDSIRFIQSRLKLFGLELGHLPNRTMGRIHACCDGSPLFMQDLLRLCIAGETIDGAIRIWEERGGENARHYALGREFEMLSLEAKRVLLSCALYNGDVSLPEIQVVTELSADNCRAAIQELQQLFLLPRSPLVGDEPRFALNVNTRRLVLEVEGRSDLANRLRALIKETTGKSQVSPARRKQFSQFSRQALSSAKLGDFEAAEETILGAIELYPEVADLHGTLGWIYKTWEPQPRFTDAREKFSRAADLKASRQDTYWHWSRMEQQLSEWTAAAVAAEKGLELVSTSERLSYMAGFSRSRLAQDLYRQAQYGRSRQEAETAGSHLDAALVDLEHLETGQYHFHSRVYRAIAINYEYLVRISQALRDARAERIYLRLLSRTLDKWVSEHPSDLYVESERWRIMNSFGDLISELDAE